MKLKSILIISLFGISCHTMRRVSQSNKDIQILKIEIEKKLAAVEGNFAVAFKDLQNGDNIYINSTENFHAASTMKTPVMIEVFKQVKAGKLGLADSIVIKNTFKSIVDGSLYHLDSSSDSQTELYRHVGEKATLYHLLYEMIIASSNLSTNLIIELVDAKKNIFG